jgi:hypothetical protein
MLPTIDDLFDYLGVEGQARTVAAPMAERMLAQARAAVEAYIGQPIEARAVSMTVAPVWGGSAGVRTRRLALPYAPIDANSVIVTDEDGDTVDGGTYLVNAATGRVTPDGAAGFTGSVYVVTARAGLSLRADYAEAIEPVMSSAILDWAADLYQRRNPAASYESGGGGVAVNYNETASKTMPSRIKVTLEPWRRIPV